MENTGNPQVTSRTGQRVAAKYPGPFLSSLTTRLPSEEDRAQDKPGIDL